MEIDQKCQFQSTCVINFDFLDLLMDITVMFFHLLIDYCLNLIEKISKIDQK